MDMGDTETRARVWAALGNQPGVGAWVAVWLLARLSGATAQQRQTGPKGAPLRRGSSQVFAAH